MRKAGKNKNILIKWLFQLQTSLILQRSLAYLNLKNIYLPLYNIVDIL